MGCIIPVHPLVNSSTRGGFTLILEGKTVATFGEGTVLDTIFAEKPEQWAFKIQMIEEDGKVPALKFGSDTDFTGCDFDLKITPKIKKGTYVLIEFANKVSNGYVYVLEDAMTPLTQSVYERMTESGRPYTLFAKAIKLPT